jgi:hypothetical protein
MIARRVAAVLLCAGCLLGNAWNGLDVSGTVAKDAEMHYRTPKLAPGDYQFRQRRSVRARRRRADADRVRLPPRRADLERDLLRAPRAVGGHPRDGEGHRSDVDVPGRRPHALTLI